MKFVQTFVILQARFIPESWQRFRQENNSVQAATKRAFQTRDAEITLAEMLADLTDHLSKGGNRNIG